jgi:endonuclease/exonuclease/phosphatase family metal-dependent hydrolase
MQFTDPPRRLTLGLALAGFAGSLLAALAPVASSPASGADAVVVPMHIGSYNIEINKPIDQFRKAVDFIKSQSDVAGLQEAGGAPRRRYLDGDKSWRIYHPPNLPQDPVIWNPKVYELIKARQVKLSKRARVEGRSGGTMRWDANWSPVVRLRQIDTGYRFAFINVHLIRGAVNEGRPRSNAPRTYRVWVHEVRALKELVAKQRAAGWPVYVAGDFNIGYAADRQVRMRKAPYHKLTHQHLVADWQGRRLNNYGTHIDDSCPAGKAHCGAYIDQIWAPTAAADATVYTNEINSDHYPISATYNISKPPGYMPAIGTIGYQDTQASSPEYNKPWQSRQNPMVFKLDGNLTHGFADVQVTGGTAVQGEDFTLDDSSLYDNDLTNDRVLVYTVPNTQRGSDKSFTLSLVNPFDTLITQGVATGTILNDDE